MTREEFEHEMRLVRRLRKLAEQGIHVAEEIRGRGGPWAGSMALEARRLLNATEYYEQDRRRAAAEVARVEPSPRGLQSPDEVTS